MADNETDNLTDPDGIAHVAEGNYDEGEDDMINQNSGLESGVAHKHRHTSDSDTDSHSSNSFSTLPKAVQVHCKSKFVCDFLICCFYNALRSSRIETALRPWPSKFNTHDDGLKIEDVEAAVDQLPDLRKTSAQECLSSEDSLSVSDLLLWILNTNSCHLEALHGTEVDRVWSETGLSVGSTRISRVLKLHYSEAQEQRFERLTGNYPTFYAFHGSRIENFHSILRHGLQGHLNKVSAFGEGTYLSRELSVSLVYAAAANTWPLSSLGSRLACVAVCQVVDHPSVKRQGAGAKRARVQGEGHDELPEAYILVRNNELLRVRYLLLMAHSHVSPRGSGLIRIIRRSPVLFFLVAYCGVILLIAAYNSPAISRRCKSWFR